MLVCLICHETHSFVKTLAVIGASYLQRPLVEKAKAMGLRVICFAWSEGAVCADLVDEFYPISIVEKEQILNICEMEHINGICTIASDVAAPTVAYIAERLHLNGNRFEAAQKANDKFHMREAFSKAGITCPRYLRVCQDQYSNLSDWRFPLIVKPCDRSGSLGVMKVNTLEELRNSTEAALSLSFKHEAIVEEFIEGREISVEFISYHGVHYPLTITDKVTTGAPHFVELEHHQPADLSEELFQMIYSITQRALDALGITEGASHTEFKITEDGDIYIIELGARMGGDLIGSDLVYLSTGYDFMKGVIDVALDSFEKPLFSRKCHSGVYFLCKETERLLPLFQNENNIIPIVKKEILTGLLKPVSCSADRSGYFIYQADKRLSL